MAVSLRPTGSGGRGRYRPLAEINVTPLVDVMLVLLIVFMVAAPLATVDTPVELPASTAQAARSDVALVIGGPMVAPASNLLLGSRDALGETPR